MPLLSSPAHACANAVYYQKMRWPLPLQVTINATYAVRANAVQTKHHSESRSLGYPSFPTMLQFSFFRISGSQGEAVLSKKTSLERGIALM